MTRFQVFMFLMFFEAFIPISLEAEQAVLEPERQLAVALGDLGQVIQQLESSDNLWKRHGIGPQHVESDLAFQWAERSFRYGNYIGAIRHARRYLISLPETQPEQYLQALFILGRSYEAMGMDLKALQTYRRYLAGSLTTGTGNHGEILQVLRHLLPIAAKGDQSNQRELNRLLSSVATLTLPDQQLGELLYYTGRTAVEGRLPEMAARWFAMANEKSKDPNTRVKALYFSALIALANRQYDEANLTLAEAMQIDGEGAEEYRDLSLLALGRIALHRKDTRMARQYYEAIAESSPSYSNAMFERTLFELKDGNDAKAAELLKQYAAKFPNGGHIQKLRLVAAYIDLRAGNLDAATAGVEAASDQMSKLRQWLASNFNSQNVINHQTVKSAIRQTSVLDHSSPLLNEIERQFSQLAEMQQKVSMTRAGARNLIIATAQRPFEDIFPKMASRGQQLVGYGESVLEAGHKLAAAERLYLRDRMSDGEYQRLLNLESMRVSLLSPENRYKREKQPWKQWLTFLKGYSASTDAWYKLARIQASLKSIEFVASQQNAGQGRSAASRASVYRLKAQQVTDRLRTVVEKVSGKNVLSFTDQARFQSERMAFVKYASLLHEEERLLSSIRYGVHSAHKRLLAERYDKAWERWQYAAKQVYEGHFRLELAARDETKGLVDDVAAMVSQADKLEQLVRYLTSRLEQATADASGLLLSHFDDAISERLARLRKWRADIDWLRVEKTISAKETAQKKYQLEAELLNKEFSQAQFGAH